MSQGYIKLYRQIQDNKLWLEKREFSKAEAWIDILLNVRHSPEPEEVLLGMTTLICNQGESLKSIGTWAKRWKWTSSKVKRFLRLLKDDNMIVTTNERITNRLKVVNWAKYQTERTINEPQMNREWTASEPQTDTDNNVNNVNNEKNVNINNIVGLETHDLKGETSKELTLKKQTVPFKEDLIKFIALFNEVFKNQYRWTPKLNASYRKRRESFTEEELLNTISEFYKNPFYRGENDRGWKISPEYILRNDENPQKVLNFDLSLIQDRKDPKSFFRQDFEDRVNVREHFLNVARNKDTVVAEQKLLNSPETKKL